MSEDEKGDAQSGAAIEKAGATALSKTAGPTRQARRAVTVYWYRLRCELKSRSWWLRFALVALQVGPITYAVVKANLKSGILSVVAFFFFWFIRSWKDGQRPNIKAFEHNSAERSATLYRAIADLQRREHLSVSEVERYQADVLLYIAQYVRDHRRDSGIPTIFANLLVARNDELVVVARDREHRTPLARYPKQGMLAWIAIATGQAQFTGDLQEDSPQTGAGKPYRSILVVPVLHRKTIVGAVSIDSSSRFHFDLEWLELVDHLAPYVAMLGWTLVSDDLIMKKVGGSQGSGAP